MISGDGEEFCKEARLETDLESERYWRENLLHTSNMRKATFVGLQTTASRRYRVWPAEKFVALGKMLLDKHPSMVLLLLGAKSELRYTKDIVKNISRGSRVINLAGEYQISELPAILKTFDLLVSNDTGPLHVAIAVGTPTVSLFVPSRVEHTGPYQDLYKHKVIRKPPPCDPCLTKYCRHPWCMDLISVEEVFEVIESGFYKCK